MKGGNWNISEALELCPYELPPLKQGENAALKCRQNFILSQFNLNYYIMYELGTSLTKHHPNPETLVFNPEQTDTPTLERISSTLLGESDT